MHANATSGAGLMESRSAVLGHQGTRLEVLGDVSPKLMLDLVRVFNAFRKSQVGDATVRGAKDDIR